jgi:plasmid replication initiation protein
MRKNRVFIFDKLIVATKVTDNKTISIIFDRSVLQEVRSLLSLVMYSITVTYSTAGHCAIRYFRYKHDNIVEYQIA